MQASKLTRRSKKAIMSCVEFGMFLTYKKETAIVTSALSGLSLFWSETPEFEPRSRRNLLNRKQDSIAYSLSLSSVHCPDVTKILLKGT